MPQTTLPVASGPRATTTPSQARRAVEQQA